MPPTFPPMSQNFWMGRWTRANLNASLLEWAINILSVKEKLTLNKISIFFF